MSKIQLYLFYLSLFASFFLGQNILYSLGYYNSSDIYSPAIILMMLACLPLVLEIQRYKEEASTIVFITIMLVLTKLFGGDPDIKASVASLALPPLFLVFLVKYYNSINWKKIKHLLYVFIILDCGMAIVERLRGECFFPDLPFETFFNISGSDMFRSYALLGHPLANSGTVQTVALFILVFEESKIIKNLIFVLSIFAILCFNSRFSLVIMLLFYILYVLGDFSDKHISIKWKFFYILVMIGGVYSVFYYWCPIKN